MTKNWIIYNSEILELVAEEYKIPLGEFLYKLATNKLEQKIMDRIRELQNENNKLR